MSACLFFGWGNPSRGDDALGPILCDRLAQWLPQQSFGNRYAVEQDFQLQVEHALDLSGRSVVLFIDAAVDIAVPFHVSRVHPVKNTSVASHALSPGELLSTYLDISSEPPPVIFTLAVKGQSFDLGAPLTNEAESNLAAAWAFLIGLCAAPEEVVNTLRRAAGGDR